MMSKATKTTSTIWSSSRLSIWQLRSTKWSRSATLNLARTSYRGHARSGGRQQATKSLVRVLIKTALGSQRMQQFKHRLVPSRYLPISLLRRCRKRSRVRRSTSLSKTHCLCPLLMPRCQQTISAVEYSTLKTTLLLKCLAKTPQLTSLALAIAS